MTRSEIANRAREIVNRFPELIGLPIQVSDKMTASAGKACYRKDGGPRAMRLSFPIFSNPNNEHGFENTVLHECAHLLVGHGHGHDLTWYAKAREIGCDGTRCHTFERPKTGKVKVTCERCGSEVYVGKVVYKRMQAGAGYRHRPCGGTLKCTESVRSSSGKCTVPVDILSLLA